MNGASLQEFIANEENKDNSVFNNDYDYYYNNDYDYNYDNETDDNDSDDDYAYGYDSVDNDDVDNLYKETRTISIILKKRILLLL